MTSETPAMPAPPQPTAEHLRFTGYAGVWDVACSFYMDPSQPPMEVAGKETIEMFGAFWTQGLFECEMFGQPFRGQATLGYDPIEKEYISTWIDTMSPTHFILKGNFDAEGKVLEMTGRGFDCHSQAMTDYRTSEEHISPDERRFEMFMKLPDGNEVKVFTHHYTRAR